MRSMIVFVLVGLAGCATSTPQEVSGPSRVLPKVSNVDRSTAMRVTRYELGSYRYPVASDGSTDQLAVLRVTRVPPNYAGGPSGENVSPAYDPLPASAELRAEIAAQHDITERLRAMKSVVAATEKKIAEQYGVLLSRSEEVMKLQEQLAAERERLRELEAQLREQLPPRTAPAVAANSSPASTSTQGVKW